MKYSLLVVAALATAASAQIAPRSLTALTDTSVVTAVASFSNIVASQDDCSVVVYSDGAALLAYSSDGQGIDWTGPTTIDAAGGTPRISTVQIVDDNAVVLYERGGNLFLAISNDCGLTWNTQQLTVSGTVIPEGYALAAGNFGASSPVFGIYVAFIEENPATLQGVLSVQRSLDGGATFSAPSSSVPADSMLSCDLVDIFAEAAFVTVAFRAGGEVYSQSSVDTGVTFLPTDVLVSAGPGTADGNEIDVFAADDGRVGVFWQETSPPVGMNPPTGDILTGAISTNFGSTFAPEFVVFSPIRNINEARFGLFAGSNLVLIYEENFGEVFAQTSLDNGVSFLPAEQLSNTSSLGGGNFPNIATSDDTVVVEWNNGIPGPDQVIAVVSRDQGLSFTEEQIVGEFVLGGTTGDADFTRVAYNTKYNNCVLATRFDGDFGIGQSDELVAHGFRRAISTPSAGWTTRNAADLLSFEVDGFGSDALCLVALSGSPVGAFQLSNGCTTQLVPDFFTISFLTSFIAPLVNGAGTTSAQGNFLASLPPLGLTLNSVGVGVSLTGEISTTSDLTSIDI